MSVDVKHPLDSASTDLLEVSRHRLQPLSERLEVDRDQVQVSFTSDLIVFTYMLKIKSLVLVDEIGHLGFM